MANFIKILFGKKVPEITSEDENAQANTPQAQPTQDESEKKSFSMHDLLPSFVDMDKDPSPEEIIRVAGLTETVLHLTFKNPCPIEQDPVFQAVLNANTQSLMECLQSGKLNVGDHNELKQTFENKYSEKVAKAMIELDYWNMRMIEHAVLMKSLGPKPAYNCLSAVYSIIDIAPNPCCILIVNYAHLLLKCTILKMQNPVAIGDIVSVLKNASAFLHFEEGRNYNPQRLSASTGNPLMDMINQINAQKSNS